jgi:general secretion pathway protein C
MRFVVDRRMRAVLRRLPQGSLFTIGELLLLALLAFQVARLFYAVVTPVGPVGAWRSPRAADGEPAVLAAFDPFHRLADGGSAVVTALDLKLYGIRADQASGRGSAIIGLADGSQQSYAVGETILPGVTLKAVAFDHVTIARGASDEQLYIDQSKPAAPAVPITPAEAARTLNQLLAPAKAPQ